MDEKTAMKALVRAAAYAEIRVDRIKISNTGIRRRRTATAELNNGKSVSFKFDDLEKMSIADIIAKLGE